MKKISGTRAEQPAGVSGMLQQLLDAGNDVTFALTEDRFATGPYDCFVIRPDGDTVVGSGATPAAALETAALLEEADSGLRSAAVLRDSHVCACGHHAAEHSNIRSGECLADGCGCAMLEEAGAGLRSISADDSNGWISGPMTSQPEPPPGWKMSSGGDVLTTWLPDGRRAYIELVDSRVCVCGHHAAEHSNIKSGECLADGCECAMLGETVSFRPQVAGDTGPLFSSMTQAAAWVSGFAQAQL